MRNAFFGGLGAVLALVVGFLFAGYTIRYLGEARAGYLMVLQALMGLNALLGSVGLGTPLVRQVAVMQAEGDHGAMRRVVGSVCMTNIATGVLVSAFPVICFSWVFGWSRLGNEYETDALDATLLVSASFLVGQATTSSWQAVYQGFQRYDLNTALNTTFGLLSGATGIMVLSIAPSMTALAANGLVLSIGRSVCDGFWVRRLLGQVPKPILSWTEIRPLLKFGGWTYLGGLGGILFTNLDRLILTSFLGTGALPYYALPQRLYSQVHSTLTSQFQFLFPMLAAFGPGAEREVTRLEDRLRWFVALASGAAYTALALIGHPLLSRLVSPAFADLAIWPWLLACAQGFFNAQNIVAHYCTWAVGRAAPNALFQFLNGMLVTITSVILIPQLGYVGASLAQLWIICIALSQSLWVHRTIGGTASHILWGEAYLSPLVMAAAWTFVVGAVTQFSSDNLLAIIVSVVAGGTIGLALVWAIETKVFPDRARWATLCRAIEIPWQRFRRQAFAP